MINKTDNSIQSLISKAQSGNKEALAIILSRYEGFIYKTAVNFYINGYELKDLIQICTLSLINAVKKYDLKKSSGVNFNSYACTCIRNTLKDKLRKCTARKTKEKFCTSIYSQVCDNVELIDCLKSNQNIENDFISKEEALNLKKAIELLPRDDKELIKWFYFDRKNLKSYARYKNITYSAAKQKKLRCLLKLKEALAKPY